MNLRLINILSHISLIAVNILFLSLIITGEKNFSPRGLLNQLGVTKTQNAIINENTIENKLLENLHKPRYILAKSLLNLSNLLNIDVILLYGILCFFIMNICILILLISLKKIVNIDSSTLLLFLITLMFLTISLFMNGRGLFCFLGYIILLYLFYNDHHIIMKLFLITISFIFLSFSSGAFITGLCPAILYLLEKFNIKNLKNYSLKNIIIILPILLIPTYYIILFSIGFMYKNISYFYYSDYGIFRGLLSHGYGRYFLTNNILITITMLSLFLCCTIYFLRKLHKAFPKDVKCTIYFIFASLFIGLFGDLSLFLILVPLIFLTCYYAQCKIFKYLKN